MKKTIISSLSVLLSLSCIQNEKKELAEIKPVQGIFSNVEGFGELKEEKSQLSGPYFYKTADGRYLIEIFERKLYLIETKTNRLLSVDAEKIRREGESIIITRNGKDSPALPPSSLLEVEDDYHRRILFEQRSDGIYIK